MRARRASNHDRRRSSACGAPIFGDLGDELAHNVAQTHSSPIHTLSNIYHLSTLSMYVNNLPERMQVLRMHTSLLRMFTSAPDMVSFTNTALRPPGTCHIRLLMGTAVRDIARRGGFPLHIFTDLVLLYYHMCLYSTNVTRNPRFLNVCARYWSHKFKTYPDCTLMNFPKAMCDRS